MPPAATFTVVHRRYAEEVIPGRRLGRQGRFDSRSLRYPFTARRQAVRSVAWERHAPIFDQGDLGSCEGNAEVGCVASGPLFGALPDGHPALTEDLAVQVYTLATSLDGFPGQMPDQDTGTDSTSANAAAKQLGLIAGYLHCDGLAGLLQALQTGPVNVAFDWWSTFDMPSADGVLTIGPGARIRGGHALACRELDTAAGLIWLDNSWTVKWGKAGRCAVALPLMDRLLSEGGEAVVPVPLSAGPPVPQPPPADPLAAYLTDNRLEVWADKRHSGANAYAAQRYTWLRQQAQDRLLTGGG